jgi:isoquinoline 1-oxidoreductase alpha subunit
LLWVLRDTLDLKGTQVRLRSGPMRCLHGAYGRPPDPLLPDPHRFGRHVPHYHAIEAISESKIGQNVQAAWIELDVPQCGYCQAGQIMSATALLVRIPAPTDHDINVAMSGNVCRCATYTRIRAAIKHAAEAGRT